MTSLKSTSSSRSSRDRSLAQALGIAALVSGGAVLLILVFVAREALPALRDPGLARMLVEDERWLPGRLPSPEFAVAPMLVGSALVTLGALLLAAPWGVLAAVYGQFFAPPGVARWHRRVLELLAGIPSVVFGFWGLTVLVPWINGLHPPGQSLLAGALVLALMILPTVALTADAALAAVPRDDLLGASALGLGRWTTIAGVALPGARTGILGGVALAAGRAVGETMAVLMVCGNIPQIPRSLFDPVRPATATIALEMGYAGADHRAALFAVALFLIMAIAGAYACRRFVLELQRV